MMEKMLSNGESVKQKGSKRSGGSRRRKVREKKVTGTVAGLCIILLLALGLLLWGLGLFSSKEDVRVTNTPQDQESVPVLLTDVLIRQLANQYLTLHSISPSRMKVDTYKITVFESDNLAIITGTLSDLSNVDEPDSKVTMRYAMGLRLGKTLLTPPSSTVQVELSVVAPLLKLKVGEREIANMDWPLGEEAWQNALKP